jgi:protease I
MTEAIADGNLVTGPAWPAHPAWLAKYNEVLMQHLSKQAAA